MERRIRIVIAPNRAAAEHYAHEQGWTQEEWVYHRTLLLGLRVDAGDVHRPDGFVDSPGWEDYVACRVRWAPK